MRRPRLSGQAAGKIPARFGIQTVRATLGHSRLGAGPIVIHKMSADGKHLLDSGKTVYEGLVAEGNKDR